MAATIQRPYLVAYPDCWKIGEVSGEPVAKPAFAPVFNFSKSGWITQYGSVEFGSWLDQISGGNQNDMDPFVLKLER